MKKLMLMAALCLMGMAAQAQQNLSWGQGPQVASPDVHADNSVTFNLIAPEAQKVQITGDMLPTKKVEFAGNTYDRGYNYVRSRKYYRCVDDKILGGVCSGAAAYFNIADPLPIRLGAIIATLLLIGLPLPIIYIVMWLATPAALTPEDRLRQQGREVTPENITLQVKEESQKALMPRGETHKGCLIALIIVIFIVFALLFVGPLMAFIGVFFGILSKMPF